MFRQNSVLNDFVNFLKARGRFREIEFIDNSVHATPRIPDFPSIIFYIEETRTEPKQLQYVLEIHGNESSVMNREIREFFNLNKLNVQKIRSKYHLISETDEEIICEVTGMGSSFDSFLEKIQALFNVAQVNLDKTQKTLIFGSESTQKPVSKQKRPTQISSVPKLENRQKTPTISPVMSKAKPKLSPDSKSTLESQTPEIKTIQKPISSEIKEKPQKSVTYDSYDDLSEIKKEKDDFNEDDLFKQPPSEKTESIPQDEDPEVDLFRMEPPEKSYSDDVAPYLKQTTGLFRKDNWEEDLPTEMEMEILDRTFARIKHRTKPEILAKDIDIPIEEAEKHLRNLISKGLLRTQVGWFIIKKSHLPFFKKTFSDSNRKKKKKKSPRISRTGEGLTSEEIATIKAIKSRPNLKAQSNLLTRPTGLKQSILKEVLRNLVDKGILRVSYGWYILKDKHILEQKRGTQALDSLASTKPDLRIPKGVKLSDSEIQVIKALLQRPQYKAQSNLLTSEVKLSKDQIKQVLRELVDKDICKVTYGWYTLKNPNHFIS
jgi:predicted transcriptional regulator